MSRGAARSTYLSWLARALAPVDATSSTDGPDDLVLGYATGYGRSDVEAFVRSLRAVHDGPVGLFVDPDPTFRDWLKSHGVEALDATTGSGWAPLPVVARFGDYARLIESRPTLRNVMLTDVRDVVFQASPFAEPISGLEVFVEDEDHVLGQNAFHSKYLRALAGDEIAATISDRPCLCAGTLIGPASDIARLCRLILTLGAIPRSSVGGGFGIDQASLELAVHQGLVAASIRPNYSRVATLGQCIEGVRVDRDRITNPDGSVSPVVHQYDRHPELMGLVRGLWGAEMRDRVQTGPQGFSRARAKLKATLSRYLLEFR